MKKLKIILLFSLILILSLRWYYNSSYVSIYSNKTNTISGIISNIKLDEGKTTITLKAKENIIVKYYDEITLKVGDVITVTGQIKDPSSNTVFNLFNYKKYLLSKRIYKVIQADTIVKLHTSNNILYRVRNIINDRLNNLDNSYLYTLILADNRIDDEIYETYQNNGISHLFSISGMHIGLFSLILLKIFNIFFKNRRFSYLIASFLLLLYMIIIGTPSVIRSVLMFLSLSLLKIFKVKINSFYILLSILYILLLINPYYIYDVGFKYSFIISLALIKFNNLYNNKNYFIKLFLISLIAFLVSYPITINNNFEINLLSPLINLIFVPLVSLIIFPLALIVFIIPSLNNFFNIFINILEILSQVINRYSIILSFSHMNLYAIITYYIILYFLLSKIKLRKILILVIFFFCHYHIHFLNFSNVLTMIDVGQGDAFLVELKNKEVILIDTGGNLYYDLAENTLIPYLKSLGIRKIDYLILSHGDYDHIGSSKTLINNFKISNIMMNSGNNNELEAEIIQMSLDKKIKLQQASKTKLNISGNFFYFLNNINSEENNDSLIVYTKLNNYGILFMGDSTISEEQALLKNYELDIDILKVGHHGSKTSTSEDFIKALRPKYALISVALNNCYKHPNEEVLEVLNRYDVDIYLTSIDGSVRFVLDDNLTIYTTIPLTR